MGVCICLLAGVSHSVQGCQTLWLIGRTMVAIEIHTAVGGNDGGGNGL